MNKQCTSILVYCYDYYLFTKTLGAINGGAFLSLAEERVLQVAAPQLLAGVVGAVLKETVMLAFTHAAYAGKDYNIASNE